MTENGSSMRTAPDNDADLLLGPQRRPFGTLEAASRKLVPLLAALEYEKEGEAGNFAKALTIANAADARTAVFEAVRILYEGFGYRGQWPLSITTAEESRAQGEQVHTSLTPQDFAKVAAIASDRELLQLGNAMRLVRLHRLSAADEIGVSPALRLASGVTSAWLTGQLATFIASWKDLESLPKRTAGRQKGSRRVTVIH